MNFSAGRPAMWRQPVAITVKISAVMRQRLREVVMAWSPALGPKHTSPEHFSFVNLTKCLAGLTFSSRCQKFPKADYSSAWPLARALPAPCRFARQGSSSPRAGNLNRKNTGRNAGNEKSSHDGHGGGGGRAGIRTAGLCHG